MPRLSRTSSRTASPSRFSAGNSSRRQSRLIIQDLPAQRQRQSSIGSIVQRSRRGSVSSRRSYSASAEDLTLRRRSFINGNTIASRPTDIKRWDGNRRTASNWDCLRRDPELWFPSGDCLVHFYGRGQSRRGASLRILLADVESSNCRPLLEKSCSSPVPESPSPSVSSSSDDGGFFTNPSSSGKYELYIPAPPHLNREEALEYHLTTRNFFAWMFEKPLVGHNLGESLVCLQERMKEFRPDPEENQDDLLAYIDVMGYTDFRDCPDHALAVLHFAEKFEYRDLWTDAFVHCAGMNNQLVASTEFMLISRTTKALITRAHLEMDVRLDRAGRALGDFMEEEFSLGYLGINSDAQKHLERFRSFLQSFYIQRHGYWPPTLNRRTSALPKSILLSMYFDFRNLYEYLVDQTFTASMAEIRSTAGGIYGLESINAFDKRYKYATLPNPLPRLPANAAFPAPQKSKPFAKLFGNKQAKMEHRMAEYTALVRATNCDDIKIMESGLVREYFRFEREWTLREEEKISSPGARKVRWLLVYTILQTLISVTRVPQEVRDTEGVTYPLCCQTAGTPPWNTSKPSPPPTTATPSRNGHKRSSAIITPIELPTPISQIHPAYRGPSRNSNVGGTPAPSTPSAAHRPEPLHMHPTPNPRSQSTPDLRSTLQTPTRSAPPIAPLTVRHPQPRKPFCEILINGYGNGSNIHNSVVTLPEPPFLSEGESSPSDPATPSSARTAHSYAWGPSGSEDVMEAGMRGSPSIYDESGDAGDEMEFACLGEWKRLGKGLVRGLMVERERVRWGEMEEAGRWGSSSVESWAPRRVNPEVDMYVRA
ncbi:hypothetical protein MMC30_000301 [Trapelia coarctata]|nr:hypothetical protein [Trapelia coarctata]